MTSSKIFKLHSSWMSPVHFTRRTASSLQARYHHSQGGSASVRWDTAPRGGCSLPSCFTRASLASHGRGSGQGGCLLQRGFSSTAQTSDSSSSSNEAAAQQGRGPTFPGTHDPTIILFPGQGAQYVGMGSALLERPSVREMFSSASEILKFDLKEACLRGPLDYLSRTQVQQPAILVCSLAALHQLQTDNPAAVESCVATAGFSLGEITALTFAGAISFEDAVRVIKVRSEGMQEASEATPGGLLTVFTGPDSDLESCIEAALQACLSSGVATPECKVANYLAPHCRVVGGSEQALQYISDHASQFGLKRVKRVNVSGAFHTAHMAPAAGALATALENTPLSTPRLPVYSNIDAAPYSDTDHIRRYLPRQVFSSVMWEHTLRALYEGGPGGPAPRTFECGPGRSLKGIVKMVNADAFANTFNVEA